MILQRNNLPNIDQVSEEMSHMLGDYNASEFRQFFCLLSAMPGWRQRV